MKFVVSSNKLLNHLQSISRVLNSKNTLPILDCFLFNLENTKLHLTSADMETRLETSVDVTSVEGKGCIAINAKNILDPLKELPDQPLTFDINDDTLEIYIYYHNGKYNFMGVKGEEYPKAKELDENVTTIKMSASSLFEGINTTLYATADDEMRPIMNGIYFDLTSEGLTFVASDGHKLVRLINDKINVEDSRLSFILAKKPANLLKTLLLKEEGDIEIKSDNNNAHIYMSNYKLTCRFIEGRYPNYNSVIPQNNPNIVVLDRLAFLWALRRVAVFSNSASSLVKIQVSDEKLIVSAQDIDFQTSAEEIVPCTYKGSAMSIGFKGTFLIEIINNIPSSDIKIELSDPSRAGIITPVDTEGSDLLTLLMPMMINN